MAVIDQERVNRIKQVLKWNPRGMTISDLTKKMQINRNLIAKNLDMLVISGQVEMQTGRCGKGVLPFAESAGGVNA